MDEESPDSFSLSFMVTDGPTMCLSDKRVSLARIHPRYLRAGRPHLRRFFDVLWASCGYHRYSALRLLHRPLSSVPPKRAGPNLIYDPAQLLPVLKTVWLASDLLCSKLLYVALPEWIEHDVRRSVPLPEAFKIILFMFSPAHIDRLL